MFCLSFNEQNSSNSGCCIVMRVRSACIKFVLSICNPVTLAGSKSIKYFGDKLISLHFYFSFRDLAKNRKVKNHGSLKSQSRKLQRAAQSTPYRLVPLPIRINHAKLVLLLEFPGRF